MQIKKTFFIVLAVMLYVSACKQSTTKTTDGAPVRKFLDRKNMDTTIRPGDNFYEYANGGWRKNNPIPKDELEWGGFTELQEDNYGKLHSILDSVATLINVPNGSISQKIGDFYRSGMDSVTINKMGLTPLNDIISRIDNITDADGVMETVAWLHTQGLYMLFKFSILPDDKNVTKEICQFAQGGIGLRSRGYYFDKDTRTAKIRAEYKQYISKMFVLLGDEGRMVDKDAIDIYNLQELLAGASLTIEEQNDAYKIYNKFDIASINKLTPGLDWKMLLSNLKVNDQDSILVAAPKFFVELAKVIKSVPVTTWKKYLKFHLVDDLSSYMSDEFDTVQFNFYNRELYGAEVESPRWKNVLQLIDGTLGEMLGQFYVERYFKPEAKKRTMEIINNLQQTYAERIQQQDWMTDSTKKKALTKLHAFVKKIGYPDKWTDYSALTIVRDDYLKNVIAVCRWRYNYKLGKLGKPVDQSEWVLAPTSVGAFYNPQFNDILFPAGILQFPFFDEDADDAVNYGGIGAVIGHEMTHGFDDQGRLYDEVGNLRNWWSPADSANFTKKANKVVDQFNKIVVADTIHANGRLLESENLADFGGVNIAYAAFKKTKQGIGNEKIDGFTPDQRFFLSWAQIWRYNSRPEAAAAQLKTDTHAAPYLRTNMPLSNMDAWYKAFDIKPGDKLYRPENERAVVW